MNKTRERYVIDLTYLPIEIIQGIDYNYIFNIIGLFSKFIMTYKLTNKKSETIVSKLKLCFDKYGISEQLYCDNGTEFINKKVQNLLDKENIVLIKGMPYNPYSQGVVERAHRIVRNSLICEYLEDISSFNIENSLKKVINLYNNTVHLTNKNL